MINDVKADKMFEYCTNLKKIKINKIYYNIFEKILGDDDKTDIILSVDIEVEKKWMKYYLEKILIHFWMLYLINFLNL